MGLFTLLCLFERVAVEGMMTIPLPVVLYGCIGEEAVQGMGMESITESGERGASQQFEYVFSG